MITKLIKYCPNCKKKVAVVKGGKPNKQRYKCTVCKKRFVDRKYGIEIRAMAAIFSKCGYSLRETSKVFGVSPNTVRNWIKINYGCSIPKKTYIDLLKRYKLLCEKQVALKLKIDELKSELKRAKNYWALKDEEENLYNERDKQERYSSNYILYSIELDKLHSRILSIEKPKDFLTVEKIEMQLSSAKNKYTKYNEKINRIESKTTLARKQYNLEALINVLEKITHKE